MQRHIFLVFSILVFISCSISPVWANPWTYNIETGEVGINSSKTSALVDAKAVDNPDYDSREIRLPRSAPNIAAFWDDLDTFDYTVLTPLGVMRMDAGTPELVQDLKNNLPDNPVAVFTGATYPDVIVAHGLDPQNMSITHYSSIGTELVPNPILSISGLTHITSIGSRGYDVGALSEAGFTYYAFTGDEMFEVPALSVASSQIQNPIAMSMFTDHYGTIIIDGDSIKYYKDGSLTSTLTGLEGAISVSTTEGGNLSVVTKEDVRHYNLIDNNLNYNSILSVTSGLTSPTAVALRPGSFDRIIVDGNEIQYWMWDGTQLIKNDVLSMVVEGLQNIGGYLESAIVESIEYILDDELIASHVRVSIIPGLKVQEADTNIKWYVNATSGEAGWRETNLNEWALVPEGQRIRWKAELSTENKENTPRINPVIQLEVNQRPEPPELLMPSGCYLNSDPVIRWKYSDPDGDPQAAFRVLIKDTGGNTIEDSGKVITLGAPIYEYIVDQSNQGKLFNSGYSNFSAEVWVWDTLADGEGNPIEGVMSDSATGNFCVTAFDRPIAKEIITPPSNDSWIIKRMGSDALPPTKAGGLVVLNVHAIGINTADMTFPYPNGESIVVGSPQIIGSTGTNNIFEVSFYTDANTDIVPTGTIVEGFFKGNGDLLDLLILRPGVIPLYSEAPGPEIPNWHHWEGYRWWSEGVVQINESAFNNWSVVLQGRET